MKRAVHKHLCQERCDANSHACSVPRRC